VSNAKLAGSELRSAMETPAERH